jgi:hypothetical protein
LAPESEQLLNLPAKHLKEIKKSKNEDDDDDEEGDVIIQRYVCNEMVRQSKNVDFLAFHKLTRSLSFSRFRRLVLFL